jgi:hypothetical protein
MHAHAAASAALKLCWHDGLLADGSSRDGFQQRKADLQYGTYGTRIMVSRVLCRQGASPRVSAMLYQAIVQSVLLFGSDSWVLTESMIRLLKSFHHRMARQITGRRARFCRITQEWDGKISASVGMSTIEEYISRWRKTIAEYIATRPIFQAASSASRRRTAMIDGRSEVVQEHLLPLCPLITDCDSWIPKKHDLAG